MREIKFRGKRADNGKWIYGYYVLENNDRNIIIDFMGIWHLLIAGTVGQFTGLLDKNGKEIYEGDILYIERDCETRKLHSPTFEKIYWKDGGFICHRTRYPTDFIKYEIVGNEFENPEFSKNERE